MGWRSIFRGRPQRATPVETPERLSIEHLESRQLLDATASLIAGQLAIQGSNGNDYLYLSKDTVHNQLVLQDGSHTQRFSAAAVTQITINSGNGNDLVRVAANVLQPTTITGGVGNDVFYAGGGPTTLTGGTGTNRLVGGSGPTTIHGGPGNNQLYAGAGPTTFLAGSGFNIFYNVKGTDTVTGAGPNDQIVRNDVGVAPVELLTVSDVDQLLQRAAAASASTDAIIAIVDRNGNILGVRVEGGVSSQVTGNSQTLTFAIDGAVSLARTGAFFSSNQGALTSRTVQYISQSTITQREVDSSPDVADQNSPLYGPGFVAPIGVGGHFPPGIQYTPQVDLFGIENTNRDSLLLPGPDGIRGTADDITLTNRFNIDGTFVPPGQSINLTTPESYGFQAFGTANPAHFAQSRGIATLPGGIPLYKNGQLVGGIGVFFPGTTGYATAENSRLSAGYDPSKPDRSIEAEWMAFAAAGGSKMASVPVGSLGGIAPVPGFDLPFSRIDLVGITLPIYGPNPVQGPAQLAQLGPGYGVGNPNDGTNAPLTVGGVTERAGQPVPSGWLVTPHAGGGLSANQVEQMILDGIAQANLTRAAIRGPIGQHTSMVFAVSDTNGNVLGLYRMPDAPVFSIGVAVAKSRNAAYYANPAQLQPIDQVPGIPAGAAFTARTFRYLAQPRFPEGIDGDAPGPFSILNDGGANPVNGLNVGPPLPASAFQSALGHDAFNPDTNFHDPFNLANQNGVVFFPGSTPVYAGTQLAGGLGVSGDGVDQDDVVTAFASTGYAAPQNLHADQYSFRGIRLPFQKFDRNPEG
jgi:uncharacterized protein GlcG (DUF336 family)